MGYWTCVLLFCEKVSLMILGQRSNIRLISKGDPHGRKGGQVWGVISVIDS